jgi:molybdate transport system substrate-binding protein
VKSVVNKVRLGEVDAGIAYASDAADNAATDLTTLPVPPEFNPTADYPIGRLRQAKSPELGMEFEDLVLSEAGQGVIRKHGLLGK